MRKLKKNWQKWYVQLILILIPLTLGLIGYGAYYCKKGGMPDMALFSSIRLFGFMYDGDKDSREWYDIVLAAARWLAVIPTGCALNRLLRPFTTRFYSRIGFHVWNRSRNRLLVFGSCRECRHIYDTAEGYRPIIRCDSYEECLRLRKDGYRCVQMTPEEVMTAAVIGTFSGSGRKCRIVIHEQNEEMNLALCKIAAAEIRKEYEAFIVRLESLKGQEKSPALVKEICRLEETINHKLERIRIVVFGDKNLENAYLDIVQQSYGVLKYTNKYRMEAMDLVEKYPLIRFVDRGKYVDETGLLSGQVDLNVVLVGFGDTNQEVFTSSMMVNQFVAGEENEIPQMKQVNYYIFDKEPVETNKNLNHMAFRFEHEFLGEVNSKMIQEKDYLTLPKDPALNLFDQTNINDQKFYNNVWQIISKNPDSVNVIFIACGTDLENIDLAQKLRAKTKEWNIGCIHLFVKIRKADNRSVFENVLSDELIPFGDEMKPFVMQNVFNDELEEMAWEKHYLNALIKNSSKEGNEQKDEEVEIHARYEWNTNDPMKKKSNMYSILSIRSKLMLMGMDYRKKTGDPQAIRGNEEYFAVYAKNDRPGIVRVIETAAGTEVYEYPPVPEKESFRKHTLRKSLAIQEHYRWTAFLICNGFVPASKAQILEGNMKDYDLRFHSCLTTFEGMFDYREFLEKANRDPAEINRIISYDFHLMDDLWWYLNMFGYEIINA